MVGLSLLTSYVMAQSIVSSTTIDAKGRFGSTSTVLLNNGVELHPSDMFLPSPRFVIYTEDTMSLGSVKISFDKDRISSTDPLVVPSQDPPIELGNDPRLAEFDSDSGSVNSLMSEERIDLISDFSYVPDVDGDLANFDTFRKSSWTS